MKKKTVGIIMLAIGIMAVIGSIPNKFYQSLVMNLYLSDIVALVIMIGLIIGGIVLIISEKSK